MAAFDRAVALGVDGLELDVRLSRDGVPMVVHDRTLDRTTNVTGAVSDWSADEMARADAAARFVGPRAGDFRGAGIGVPTLAAVLARHRDVRVIIEMKDNSVTLARATVRSVREADAVDRVCLGAFGRRALREARQLEPALATSASREEVRWALYRSWVRWPVSRVAYRGYQIPEVSRRRHVASPRFVADAHRAGLRVQVWTVDSEEAVARLTACGVDDFITDRPDIVLPAVRAHAARSALLASSA